MCKTDWPQILTENNFKICVEYILNQKCTQINWQEIEDPNSEQCKYTEINKAVAPEFCPESSCEF